MKVHIPTNVPKLFSLWKESLGFGTPQTDRQTGRQANRISRGRRTHNMSVSLKSNAGSTFPEASLPGRRAPISLPSLPSRALDRDLEDLVPRAWSNPASGSAFVTCSSAPHGHRCRAAASRPGREAPATAAAAARPPSLPPSVSPSLPLSLPRALPLAGPPAGNLFWTKSRYLRKREKKKRHSCAKERKKDP